MRTITMKVSNAGLRFSDREQLSWSATNLPKEAFILRERETIFWELEMIDYAGGMLTVEVVDFGADPDSFDPGLTPKRPVSSLNFKPLDQKSFCEQLTYYRLTELTEYFVAARILESSPEAESTELAEFILPEPENHRPANWKLNFRTDLMDLTFYDGHVSGQTDTFTGVLSFRIRNDHLVAEFENIKPYFVRALKRKTVEVTATLVFEAGEPVIRNARSAQIARIDERMLEIFRARSVRRFATAGEERPDRDLFTPEDFFASLDDDELGKAVLPADGKELLETILRHRKVRNARQLSFLAGRLHAEEQKLRFVLSPQFGFVFLARGETVNHFVLELLDSHATYVWSIPRDWKNLAEHYRAVEREIGALNAVGRGQYRRSLGFEHEFWLVIHESANSEFVDGFPRWKNRLLEGIL